MLMARPGISREKQFWIIVSNSLSYFMLAYFTIIILTNSFSILLANIEGIKGILYYYGFDVLNQDRTWPKELTLLIFFFGIGFSFLLGVVMKRFYKKNRRHSKPFKMFYLWGFFLGFVYFFGNVLVGSFFYFGTGVIFDAFSIPWVFRIISGFIALGVLIYLGVYATRSFVISLNSYQIFIDRQEYQWFMKAQLLYPFIIGNVLILFLKIPHHNDFFMLDTVVWACGIIPIIALFVNLSNQSSIRFKKSVPDIHVFILPLALFIVVMLLYRFGLSGGLKF